MTYQSCAKSLAFSVLSRVSCLGWTPSVVGRGFALLFWDEGCGAYEGWAMMQ